MKRALLRAIQRTVPLSLRRRLAVRLDRQRRLASGRWWAVRLLSDFAERDPDAYHRFLWKHHLGYAETYEVARRFGADRIHPTRILLFEDLERWLAARGVDFRSAVRSVFEVGCSLGYLLRYLETDVLQAPDRLEGVDIDERAVRQGAAHLAAAGSVVHLHAADMDDLERVVGDRRFDLFLCCGVLMYTRAEQAQRIVATMLERGDWVAISGLAHADRDNATLESAEVRERDGAFVHNIDVMVERAGGRVVDRRWEGPRRVDGNTIYFLLATARPEDRS